MIARRKIGFFYQNHSFQEELARLEKDFLTLLVEGIRNVAFKNDVDKLEMLYSNVQFLIM